MLRTHTCGELRKSYAGKEVVLCGWVHSLREHGNVVFLDLRDRYGITLVVADKEMKELKEISKETVIKVAGKVVEKPAPNKKLETGDIEVKADKIIILNFAEPLPVDFDDPNITEESKLKYRYLDLRRPVMRGHLIKRHVAALSAREYFAKEGFIEVETPLLIKHTPEGARDYVVPSRISKGKFYSLPQSPQLYKQILMVAGMDRYFQLAKCLRDEDLRADRQPEFTQIDVEMSFVEEEDVFDIMERLVKHMFKKTINLDLETPFPRLSYQEAMERFGIDKPDMRFGLELRNVTEIMKEADFKIFKESGFVYCLNVKGGGEFTRKQIDKLNDLAKVHRAKGIFWVKWQDKEGSIVKYLTKEIYEDLQKTVDAEKNDLLVFVADDFKTSVTALGQIRNEVARMLGIIPKGTFNFLWIYKFPMFEWNRDENHWDAMHHIFSCPREEDMQFLEKDPGRVNGKIYDLTLNGVELGSGSIRINRKDVQERVLKVIGIDYSQAMYKFGFLLEAFKFGAPPHGGMALGLDRLVALMLGMTDIREVIAFPKNKKAEGMMEGSPSELDKKQLDELGLKY